jgi:hypothetical protein
MTIDSLISMRLIQSFKEDGRYEGIVSSFEQGDPGVVGCDIAALQALMEHEDMLMDFINPSASKSSAKRGKPAVSPAPKKPDKPPPCNTMQVAYRPTNSIKWDLIKQLIKTSEKCPICFHTHSFHREVGCPALAKSGLIIVEDLAKAKKIVNEYYKLNPSGKPRAEKDRDAKDGDGQGGKDNKKQKSARSRATSGERKVADALDSSNNCFAAFQESESNNQYVDNAEIESDYSDGEGIDVNFSSASDSNPKNQSSSYTLTAKARKARANNCPKSFPPWPPLPSLNTSLPYLLQYLVSKNVVLILVQLTICFQTTTHLPLTRRHQSVSLNSGMVLNLNKGGLDQSRFGSTKRRSSTSGPSLLSPPPQ